MKESPKRAENIKAVLSVWGAYAGTRIFTFADITPELVADFRADQLAKGRKESSVDAYCRTLKLVYRLGIEHYRLEFDNPFGRKSVVYEKKTGSLTVEQLRRIRNADLSDAPKLDVARQLFMLSFYMGGMSFHQLATMRWADAGHTMVGYKDAAGGTVGYRRLSTCARAIIDEMGSDGKYVLPLGLEDADGVDDRQIRNCAQKVNYRLKALTERLGLGETLTFLLARESWRAIEPRIRYIVPLG